MSVQHCGLHDYYLWLSKNIRIIVLRMLMSLFYECVPITHLDSMWVFVWQSHKAMVQFFPLSFFAQHMFIDSILTTSKSLFQNSCRFVQEWAFHQSLITLTLLQLGWSHSKMYQIDFEIMFLLSNKTRNTANLKNCTKKPL